MKIRLSLVLFVLFVFAAVWVVSVMSGYAATRTRAIVREPVRAAKVVAVCRTNTGEVRKEK